MVEGLIAGPQSHLGEALVNAIPSGTSISSGGIELSDHVAKVSLNGSLPADERAKRLLAWEISQTLQRSGRVNSVEIGMGGETLETSDLPTQPSYDLDTAVAFSSEADDVFAFPAGCSLVFCFSSCGFAGVFLSCCLARG